MCGIIGYIGKKNVAPILIEGLKKLEYRGYDSAGIAVVDDGPIEIRRAKGKISVLEDVLKQGKAEGHYGIGHTRWATHGRPSEKNAHPHQDCTGDIVIAHNGIIENFMELKKQLSAEGHKFQTETDTEVIAHLIEKYFQKNLEKAVRQALKHLEGDFALAVISSRDRDKIVLVKHGPPVIIGLGEHEYFVSSDVNPLLIHTKDVVFLNDGEMAVVKREGVIYTDFSGRSVKINIKHINWNPQMIEKGGFKHYMLKEIFDQPKVIRDTLEGRISMDKGKVLLEEIGLSAERIKKIERVVILACGTSFNASLVGKYFIEEIAEVPVDVEYASEYRYRNFILDKNSLVVAVSQSGETADTLAAVRALKIKKPLTLSICNVAGSSIARETTGLLMTHAGPEIGVAATKTFTAQMTALILLALYLGQLKGTLDKKTSLSYIEELQYIPPKIESILYHKKGLENLAKKFVSSFHFLYLGRWVNYPIALEGALKLKEISYIHAEGYPSGEMKHGPIALIDDKMPTMAIVPKDRIYEKMISNISEVKARQGYVVAVAYKDDEEIEKKVDDVIRIPSTLPLLSPFLTTVPLQIFAYYIAFARGADVDQPRNLAKSVTVE